MAMFLMSIIRTNFIPYHNLRSSRSNISYQGRNMVNQASLLASVMMNQTIIQTAISSVKTFDGNKNKFEAWIASVEKVVKLSCKDILWIAFSRMVGSSLTTAHRLRDRSPNLAWGELKSKLSRQYSSIPFDSHDTQTLSYLQQGLDELMKCIHTMQVSFIENQPHVRHVSDVSGGSDCTMEYGLNCRKLKDSVVGHQTMHWKSMEDCFRDICPLGVGYERTKGYCRADFDTPEVSTINEVKSTKDLGPCFRCIRPISEADAQNTEINLTTHPEHITYTTELQ